MKNYKAKIKIVFDGTIEVAAENKYLAKEYIKKHFGVTGLNCHASISEIDWDICLTPEKHIGKICLAK